MENLSLELLEFRKLLSIISALANSEASGKRVLEVLPLGSKDDILARQRRIGEIIRMSQEGFPLRLSAFSGLSSLMLKVRPAGAVLEAGELAGFMPVLEIAETVSEQIAVRDDLPALKEYAGDLTGFPDILRLLRRSVDSEGNILDGASAMLSDLRERTRRLDARIVKRLEEMVRDESLSVFLQDDFITKRSGRWVIPVRMDSKGQVAGVVHDVSKSGETAFVEPLAIINLANELENLIAEQRAEEIRILRNISAAIREAADGIAAEYETVVGLDILNCMARFAEELDMEIPLINETGGISVARARHPLLQLAFRNAGGTRNIVPLDIKLGDGDTVMVITGSNAGGKTIAVKTIGLLTLMALSGMPVPADSSSSFPLLKGLMADMGDEQSIESSLSTFSAHVSNISRILRGADGATLVLIDELGTGTDPEEGAALACAVLNELRRSGALVFATTHLAQIKGFVHRTEGMLNASMEFDGKTLSPLYKLRIGEPGQSHALETARRYGLPDSIVDSAKAMLGGVQVEFDNLIADLNEKRARYEAALGDMSRRQEEMEKERGLLEAALAEAEERRKEILAGSYREAAEMISGVKREMNSLIEELKAKEKTKRREVVREVEAKQREITEKLSRLEGDETDTLSVEEIEAGDTVFIRSLGYDAAVLSVMGQQNRVKVAAGNMEIEVPLSDVARKKGKAVQKEMPAFRTETMEETMSSSINLIGLRVDDALSRLEPFLNHASLAGLPEVTVIHGLGTGTLSKAVREYLEGHPLVGRFRPGKKYEGGDGVTVVTMV
ncbi:MAG: endonuclease MutS2 [Candidatus Sulfobium sp.]